MDFSRKRAEYAGAVTIFFTLRPKVICARGAEFIRVMTKDEAESIYQLVNHKQWPALEAHINATLEKVRDELEYLKDDKLHTAQGKCSALRSFLKIRGNVNDTLTPKK